MHSEYQPEQTESTLFPSRNNMFRVLKSQNLACKQYDKVLHSERKTVVPVQTGSWLTHFEWLIGFMSKPFLLTSAGACRTVDQCCVVLICLDILSSYSGVGRIKLMSNTLTFQSFRCDYFIKQLVNGPGVIFPRKYHTELISPSD